MSAYQKSIDLNLDGTDAQKVAILQTISNSDISRANLASWLARKGLLDFDGNTWFGLLQDKINDGTIAGPLLLLLKQLKSVVLSVGGESLRTTTPPFCVQVYAGLSSIASAVPAAATLCSEFYDALDGGRPYKDLTVEEFAAQRTAAVSKAESTAAIAAKRGKLQDAHIAVSAWIADNSHCTRDQVLSQFVIALSSEGWV